MKELWFPVFLAATAALVFPLGEAAAQWNNAPYQSSFRGPAAGAGMSAAYRQVIILDRLADSVSRNNLHRLPSGLLSNVIREDGQAFVATPEGLPLPRGRAFSGSGFGYGGFGYDGFDGYLRRSALPASYRGGLHASVAFNDWWPIVAEGMTAPAPSFSASPIDGWIAQLDGL